MNRDTGILDVCAGIVAYNPEIDKLCNNIRSIISQVKEVIIVDNGSINYDEWSSVIKKEWETVQIIRNNQNLGVAKALNQLCLYGTKQGYCWILTLDQDSICSENMIARMSENTALNVAIIAPNIVYVNNEKFAVHNKYGVQNTEWVISSASLTNLFVWKEIGGFDDVLFIDDVDRDFCLRARKAGYEILKDYNIELLHELGNLKCIQVLGKTIYITHHSGIRKYYMTRNAVYLDKKYGTNDAWIYIVKLLLKTIVFEKNKCYKIKKMFHGVNDGIKMKISSL